MEIKNNWNRPDAEEYFYLYEILKKHFSFNEKKYGDYIKDTIKILMYEEKNGEPIVNIDDNQIVCDLLMEGWPDIHLKALEETGLINKDNSPIDFQNRCISWKRWANKLEKIKSDLIKKSTYKFGSQIQEKLKKIDDLGKIKEIFKISNLALLQGGPGTGKSSLIIKLIINYLDNDKNLNIGLAAPTGKAVAKLKESINQQKNFFETNKFIKIECQTLHSWIFNINAKFCKLKFRLNELDVFIIDEMSMVNIDLLEMTISHLSNNCKILLVGDANQLPPINSCSIWNHIFNNKNQSLFKSCTINLTKTYRNSGDIELLSKIIFKAHEESINEKKIVDLSPREENNLVISWENETNIPNKLIQEIRIHLESLKNSISELNKNIQVLETDKEHLINVDKKIISNVFRNLNSNMILCQRNVGVWGVNEINKIFIKQEEPYNYESLEEGIPIMCTENNNELGLSNGDIGVLIGNNETRRFLFRKFNKNNQPVITLIEPSKLEKIIPAIAITIHKAQGSEAKIVSVLWNNKIDKNDFGDSNNVEEDQICLRGGFEKRLFYTAITRAKEKLNIFLMR